jgi:hypothetical protein
MNFPRTAVILVFLLALGTGCAKKERTYPVSGKVTLDGAPLPDGDIVLRATDNSGGHHGDVVDGEFALEATAGRKKIYITATRQVKLEDIKDPQKRDVEMKMRKAMGGPSREQYIAERYNVKTTLEAEVVPEGPNHFKFDLTSAP